MKPKTKTVAQQQKYADFIEEAKFAFVIDAFGKGQSKLAVMFAPDCAVADEMEDAANLTIRLMRCDMGIAMRGFVGEASNLLFKQKGKQYGSKFLLSAAEYLIDNYPLHFDNLGHVLRLRWLAQLMQAIINRDCEALAGRYAKHFQINPEDPTAPHEPGSHPHALRDKIVAVLADRRKAAK